MNEQPEVVQEAGVEYLVWPDGSRQRVADPQDNPRTWSAYLRFLEAEDRCE